MLPMRSTLFTALVAVAACRSAPDVVVTPGAQPSALPSSRSEPVRPVAARAGFATTAELVSDPELATLVEQLAREPVIEFPLRPYVAKHPHEKVFVDEDVDEDVDEEPNRVYGLYEKLSQSSSRAQMLALLGHRSPIVRGYIAQHFVRELPKNDRVVILPLLDDDAVVTMVGSAAHQGQGTQNTEGPLCAFVQDLVPLELARDRLLDVARASRGTCQILAMNRLAADREPALVPIAKARLFDADAQIVCASIRALAKLRAAESAEPIRALAGSSEVGIRMAVAESLGTWPSTPAASTLRRLLDDPDEQVRAQAAKSYLRQPARDFQLVQARRRTETRLVRLYIDIGLAHDGRPDSLAFLRSLLVPTERTTAGFWPLLRALAFSESYPSAAFYELVSQLGEKHSLARPSTSAPP